MKRGNDTSQYQYACSWCGATCVSDSPRRPMHCGKTAKAIGRTDKRAALPHPMQPIEDDGSDVIRFKENAAVRWMLEMGRAGTRFDLNTVACQRFCQEDMVQLAQLIGYSVSGFGDLGYVDPTSLQLADDLADTISERMRAEQDEDAKATPGTVAWLPRNSK